MAKKTLWQRIKGWLSGGNKGGNTKKSSSSSSSSAPKYSNNRPTYSRMGGGGVNRREMLNGISGTNRPTYRSMAEATKSSKDKGLAAAIDEKTNTAKYFGGQNGVKKEPPKKKNIHQENLETLAARRREKTDAWHAATNHRFDVNEKGISAEERQQRRQNVKSQIADPNTMLDEEKWAMKYNKRAESLGRGVLDTMTVGLSDLAAKRLSTGAAKEAEEYYQANKSKGWETAGRFIGALVPYGGTAGAFESLGAKAVGRAATTQVGKKLGAEALAKTMAGTGAKAALARSLVGDAIQDSTIGAIDTTMDIAGRDDLETPSDYLKAWLEGQALNYGMGLAGNVAGHALPVAGKAVRNAWDDFADESRKLRVVPKSTMDFMDDFVNDVGNGTHRNLVMNGGTTRASRLQGLEHEIGLKPKKLTSKARRASDARIAANEAEEVATQARIDKAPSDVLQGYSSKGSKKKISDVQKRAKKLIANGDVDGARREVEGAVDDILRSTKTVAPLDNTTEEIKEFLKNTKISVSDKAKVDAGYESGGYGEFRKQNFGSLKLTKDGTPVDDLWLFLQEQYGTGIFPDEITHPTEQLRFLSELAKSKGKEFGLEGDELSFVKNELTDSIWDSVNKQAAPQQGVKQAAETLEPKASDVGAPEKQNALDKLADKFEKDRPNRAKELQEQYPNQHFARVFKENKKTKNVFAETETGELFVGRPDGDGGLSAHRDSARGFEGGWYKAEDYERALADYNSLNGYTKKSKKVESEAVEAEVKAEMSEEEAFSSRFRSDERFEPFARYDALEDERDEIIDSISAVGKETEEQTRRLDEIAREMDDIKRANGGDDAFNENRAQAADSIRKDLVDEMAEDARRDVPPATAKGTKPAAKKLDAKKGKGKKTAEKPIDHDAAKRFRKNRSKKYKELKERYKAIDEIYDADKKGEWVFYKDKSGELCVGDPSREHGSHGMYDKNGDYFGKLTQENFDRAKKAFDDGNLNPTVPRGKTKVEAPEPTPKEKVDPLKTYKENLAKAKAEAKSKEVAAQKVVEPEAEPKAEAEVEPSKPKADIEQPETGVVAKGEVADAGENAKSGERTEFRRSEEPSAKEQARNRRADTNREKATQESFDKDYAAFEKKIAEVDKLRGRIRVAQGAEKEALQKQLDALKAEVERDYRKASLRYHPDRGGSNEWFSAFNKAREDFRKGNVRQGAGFRDAWSSTRKAGADAGGGNTPPPRNGAGGNGGNTPPPPKGERFADYDGLRRPKGYAKRTQRAMHSVEDMVGATKTKKTWRETLRQFRDEADRKFVDSLKDFEQVARERKKTLGKDAMEKLYGAINKARSYRARATTSVSSHQLKADGTRYKVKGEDGVMRDAPSLAEIFSGMDKETEKSFNAYLLLNHNVDRLREDKPIFKDTVLYDWDELSKRFGMSKDEIGKRLGVKAGADIDLNDADVCKNFAELYETKFSDFKNRAAQVRQFTANELNNRVEAGLLSRETMDKWLHDHPNYVPTYREGLFDGVGAVKNGAVGASDLKAAKGSDLNIYDIKEQLADATVRNWRDISLNNLLEKTFGDNIKGLAESAEVSPYIYALDHTMNVGKSADGGKFYADIYRNGKAERIEIDKRFYDDLKDLYKNGRMGNGLDGLNDKVLVPLATFWKNLITEWSPIFMVKNFMRDYPEAIINSRNRKEFLSITADGSALKDLLSEGEYTQALRDAGISASTFIDINKAVKDFDNGKGGLKTLLPKLNAGVEMYPRLVEFMATIRKAGYTKLSDIPANEYTELIDRAAANAADVTVNFGRSGSVGKLLNKGAIPFLNPSIQGWSKFARNITELDGMKDTLGFLLSATALGAAPMVATNLLYHDNPNYQQISARDKANNYIIALPPTSTTTDKFLKIPRSRFASVYGLPLVNVANENKMEWGTAFQVINDQVAPLNPIESHFGANLIQAARNKTWYGTPIESESMRTLPANERYDATTSNISIGAAQGLNKITKGKVKISPKKLDYVLDANFGVVADFALPMTTKSKKDGNVLNQFGNVGKRAFTIDSAVQNDLSTRYYDRATVLEQSKNSRDATDADKKAYDKFSSWDSRIKGVTNAMRYVQNSDMPNKQEAYRELAKLRNENMQKALDGKASINNSKDIDIIHKYAGTSYTIENLGKSADQKALKAYGAAVYGNLSEDEMRKKIDSDTEFYKGYKGIAKTQNALQKIDPNLKGGNALTYAVGLADAGANDDVFASYGTTLQSRTESASKAQRAKDYLKNNGSVEEFAQLENAVKNLGKLSDVDKDQLEDEAYAKLQSGKMSIDEYNTELKKIDYNANQSYVGKAVSLAMSGAPARAYNLYDIKGKNVQKGYNLAAMGIDSRKYRELSQACDKDGNGYLKTAEIRDYVANSDYEDKATLFDALCYYSNVRNPFGTPTNYSAAEAAEMGRRNGVTQIKVNAGADNTVFNDSESSSSGGYGGYGGYRSKYGSRKAKVPTINAKSMAAATKSAKGTTVKLEPPTPKTTPKVTTKFKKYDI